MKAYEAPAVAPRLDLAPKAKAPAEAPKVSAPPSKTIQEGELKQKKTKYVGLLPASLKKTKTLE